MNGILFKPWKIKAIAESSPDREWQTRRVIKPQPKYQKGEIYSQWYWCKKDIPLSEILPSGISYAIWNDAVKIPRSMVAFAPYGIGETVYIKEAVQLCKNRDGSWDRAATPIYKAEISSTDLVSEVCDWDWLSPLFMPEWAARYFIKFTDVRAERLQEITEQDCIAEGITVERLHYCVVCSAGGDGGNYATPREAYHELWNSINKDYPWESNPLVFVYASKRVEGRRE